MAAQRKKMALVVCVYPNTRMFYVRVSDGLTIYLKGNMEPEDARELMERIQGLGESEDILTVAGQSQYGLQAPVR